MSIQTTELKSPTMLGVATVQEQNLAMLERLVRRTQTLRDHVCGARPAQPSVAEGRPPVNGLVDSFSQDAHLAAAMLSDLSICLGEIERGLSVGGDDKAGVEGALRGVDAPEPARYGGVASTGAARGFGGPR